MHTPGEDMAPDHEENHFRVARVAVIGLVARTEDMLGRRARDDHVHVGGGCELDELALDKFGRARQRGFGGPGFGDGPNVERHVGGPNVNVTVGRSDLGRRRSLESQHRFSVHGQSDGGVLGRGQAGQERHAGGGQQAQEIFFHGTLSHRNSQSVKSRAKVIDFHAICLHYWLHLSLLWGRRYIHFLALRKGQNARIVVRTEYAESIEI